MVVKKSKNPAVATLAGAIAGGVEATSIWPLEMIKTNLQLGTMKQHYSGMYQGFKYHYNTGGIISLYRGLAPVLMGSIPKAGIRFGGFEIIQAKLKDEDGKTSALGNLAAGVTAGALEAAVAVTPMETIKTKLIDGNTGVLKGVRRILATEGFGGLYQGLTATMMKQASNQGLRFMWFSEYKQWIPSFLEKNGIVQDYASLTEGGLALVSLAGGMSAGCFSTLGNNPFDVVKTRMQGLDSKKYNGTFDCVKQIMRSEGFLGFYAGVIPRLGRVIPGQGIIFMSYDSISRFISKIVESPKKEYNQ